MSACVLPAVVSSDLCFPDARLEKRFHRIFERACRAGAVSVARSQVCSADQQAAYRFFANPRITHEHIIATARCHTLDRLAAASSFVGLSAPPLLALTDTTSIDCSHLAGALRITDPNIGPCDGFTRTPGFLAHATYLVEAPAVQAIQAPQQALSTNNFDGKLPLKVLGLLDADLWSRQYGAPDKRARGSLTLPPEEKEHYKWHRSRDAVVAAGLTVGPRKCFHVADREIDAYGDLLDCRRRGIGFIYRIAQTTRRVRAAGSINTEGSISVPDLVPLEDLVRTWQPAPSALWVRVGAGRDGSPARVAKLEIRYGSCIVGPSKHWITANGRTEEVHVGVVEIRETTVPRSGSCEFPPILWQLWVSEVPSTVDEAIQYATFYTARWRIECFFGAAKSRGFGVESTQLRTGQALKKIAAIGMAAAAVTVERLVAARAGGDEAPAVEVLGYEDEAFLKVANAHVSVTGTKAVNPHPIGTVSYVSWIVARFGGWMGLDSQGPCGSRRMAWGLARLAEFRAGYLAAKGTSNTS